MVCDVTVWGCRGARSQEDPDSFSGFSVQGFRGLGI